MNGGGFAVSVRCITRYAALSSCICRSSLRNIVGLFMLLKDCGIGLQRGASLWNVFCGLKVLVKKNLAFSSLSTVLKVSVREKDGSAVSTTVRLYGPNTEYVIDRQRELQAIPHLSAAGFGAKLLGVFGNGMVQSFIDARTLTPSGKHLEQTIYQEWTLPLHDESSPHDSVLSRF
ncbi:hypothetical protein SASPL_138478 [Salvia splendens]|uniref:ethanolamine kinase n=1 Tax=Salvia splendens TaxID=180675 RepID=A0A8X8WVI8_SALSN|nr:hypothetical protein SASPL_138478 [Salvia splendens]